jgi:hypothetical protein
VQIRRVHGGPEENNHLDHGPDRRILGDYEQPRTGFSAGQSVAEAMEHGASVMRHQNAIFYRRAFKDLRVADAFETSLLPTMRNPLQVLGGELP